MKDAEDPLPSQRRGEEGTLRLPVVVERNRLGREQQREVRRFRHERLRAETLREGDGGRVFGFMGGTTRATSLHEREDAGDERNDEEYRGPHQETAETAVRPALSLGLLLAGLEARG